MDQSNSSSSDADIDAMYAACAKHLTDQRVAAGFPANLNWLPTETRDQLHWLAKLAEDLDLVDVSPLDYLQALSSREGLHLHQVQLANKLEEANAELQQQLQSLRKYNKDLECFRENLFENADCIKTETEKLKQDEGFMRKKAESYKQKSEAIVKRMGPIDPDIEYSAILERAERLKADENRLKELQQKIASYQGLPPDLELARQKIVEMREEKESLQKIVKENLFKE